MTAQLRTGSSAKPASSRPSTAINSLSMPVWHTPSKRTEMTYDVVEHGIPAPLLADIDAEKGVIGCMVAGDEHVSKAAKLLKPEHFYDQLNKAMFECMVESNSADRVRLLTTLKKRKGFGFDTGAVVLRIQESENLIPSALNLTFYAEPVIEFAQKRALRDALNKAQSGINDGLPFTEIAGGFDSVLTDDESSKRSDDEHKDQLEDLLNYLEKCQTGEVDPMGVPTGFQDLDYMTRGIKPGDMFVVAARPGVGKTTFGLNVAAHAAMDCGKGVMFFSLEMDHRQIHKRILAARTKIDLRRLETKGALRSNELQMVGLHTAAMRKSNLRVYDKPGMKLYDIRALCRSEVKERGIDLIVIDYLQLVKCPGFRASERVQEVTEISVSIKNLARELGVGILVLAQVNRESARAERRPRMSDIRECGAVEQDADSVMILHQPDPEESSVELVIDKQRNGNTGSIRLVFEKEINRFRDDSPFSE